MFKKLGIAVIVVCALLVVAGVVMAQQASKKEIAPSAPSAPSAVTVTEVTPAAAPAVAVNVGNKICPVTGMTIAKEGEYTVEYEGKVYNLCSSACKDEFLKDPKTYVAKVDEELAKEKVAATEAPVAAPALTK